MTRLSADALQRAIAAGRIKLPAPKPKPVPKRKHKYNANRTSDFDSTREGSRYHELLLMEKAGEISNLQRQVTYELVPKQDNERAIKYIADFVFECADGKMVVEDVKSPATKRLPAFIIKRKLMLWIHGIRIKETF